MTTIFNDIKFAIRQLRKSPGFTTVVVLILALGIGATTTIFSVVNSVLLHTLPYDQPDQLVQLWEDPSGQGQARYSVGARLFADWKEQITMMEDISAVRRTHLNLTGEDRPERLSVHQVSASYLSILRVQPFIGRGFLSDEEQLGSDKVVVLTHQLWQQSFGGDPDLVGRTIRLGNDTRTVVGILPAKPRLPFEFDALVPFVFGSEKWHHARSEHRLRVIGRSKPRVTLEQVRAEMDTIMLHLRPLYPDWDELHGVVVVSMHEQITGEIRPLLWILFGVVGFVLLIICANVAGLLMTRIVARQKEIAIRSALGAGRWRIIRQLLIESLLLSLLGGMLGLFVVFWGVTLLSRFDPVNLQRVHEITVDARVFGFAFWISIFTGLILGLTPALKLTASNINDILKKSGRAKETCFGSSFRGGLMVAEVAMALMLLTGAGLLLRTMFQLASVPTGFNPQSALVMDISLDANKNPNRNRRAVFLRQILQSIESLPGVQTAGAITTFPLNDYMSTGVGRPNQPGSRIDTNYDFVSGNLFSALGIPLLQGRVFRDSDDTTAAPRVVIINQAMASKVFPNEDPLGQRIWLEDHGWEVVGVVGDVHQHGLDKDVKEHIYLPQAFSSWTGCLVMRTSVQPLALTEMIRKEILKLDPDQPVSNIRTLEQVVANSTSHRRLMFVLISLFALVALLLAAIGLYGVMTYSVSQRTQEIGIRMALGAQSGNVLIKIMRQGLKLTFLGVAIGLLGAFALTRILSHLLFGITPRDPITFVGVVLLLMLVALLACYIPARRATRINPMEALRYE